jgi:hypothetical protein
MGKGSPARAPGQRNWFILAGLYASLAAWTKNEGILFFLVAFLMVSLAEWRSRSWRRLGAFLIGGAIPLAALISFKIWFAPPSDLFLGQTPADILEKLVDGTRYITILSEMGRTTANLGGWGFPLVLVLLGYAALAWKKPSNLGDWNLTVLLLGLTLVGYSGIYLITPHPLTWHMQYSADRLMFQVYPLFLFVLFQATFSPAEIVAALAHLINRFPNRSG